MAFNDFKYSRVFFSAVLAYWCYFTLCLFKSLVTKDIMNWYIISSDSIHRLWRVNNFHRLPSLWLFFVLGILFFFFLLVIYTYTSSQFPLFFRKTNTCPYPPTIVILFWKHRPCLSLNICDMRNSIYCPWQFLFPLCPVSNCLTNFLLLFVVIVVTLLRVPNSEYCM
jgi:hypothetical protein